MIFIDMNEGRANKIKEVFKMIHGTRVPMFRWINYRHMEYWYNEETDEMECECGARITFDCQDEDINYNTVLNAIYNLQDEVCTIFKEKHNILLYDDY